MDDLQASEALDKLALIKDAMTVRRAFGDVYEIDGFTIIPVAAVSGGGGGGARKEGGPTDPSRAPGLGLGFRAVVRPVGIVVVKDGKVRWQPTVDVMRIVLCGQLLVAVAIVAMRGRRCRTNAGQRG